MKPQVKDYILSSGHCTCCDKLISDIDNYLEDELQGMCPECYDVSMTAAYEDLEDEKINKNS